MNPQEYVFNVSYNHEKDFGYELPLESHNLTVEIELDTNMEQFKGYYVEPIVIEDIESNLYTKYIPLYNEQTRQRTKKSLILSLEF